MRTFYIRINIPLIDEDTLNEDDEDGHHKALKYLASRISSSEKVLSVADVKNDLLTENYKISGILAQFSHTSAFNSVMGVKH